MCNDTLKCPRPSKVRISETIGRLWKVFIHHMTIVKPLSFIFDCVCVQTAATVLILIFGKFSDMQQSYLGTWLTAGLLVGGAIVSGTSL